MHPSRLTSIVFCFAMAGVAILLGSCGPRATGYGVLLWGSDGAAANGVVLPVIDRSSIAATVTLWDRPARLRLAVEEWRVRVFPRQADAQAFAGTYATYRDSYAFTDRAAGLPVRERPETQARRVYKVAPGQLLKVVGRSADKAKEGIFEDYWYEVLTDDGYSGFCFGYFLRSFSASFDQAKVRMQEMLAEDPMLDRLFSEAWRPEYFADMIRRGRIDLAAFSPEIGLFPDRQESEWKLVLRDFSATFVFNNAARPRSDVYTFPPSELRITVYPGDRLEVSYMREGKTARSVFVRIEEDVEEIIDRERERRQELLDAFLGPGGVLKSSAYGTIQIREDGGFEWSGFGRVPAGVFLRTVAGSGKVDFPCRLSAALAGSYDGAVSFIFDEYRSGEQTVFAYAFVSGGVQLTRVAAADIEDLEVRRLGASPLVMFFTLQDR